MSWCFRCGEAGTPERAIGVDEDGEPACAIHRDHDPRDFDQALRNKVEPAPPSPVQATEQEKADMGTKSKGLSPTAKCNKCGRSIALGQFGRHMRAKHGMEPVLVEATPVEVEEVCHETEPEMPVYEHVVTIRLPESKIAKLLELLLA